MLPRPRGRGFARGCYYRKHARLDENFQRNGVPVDTLQAEKSTTGLGYGGLENANLLANASGQSFDTIAGKFKAGEGWGEIAHDYGLNLGKLVSAAHRSSRATLHAQSDHGKSSTMHGKSATRVGNS